MSSDQLRSDLASLDRLEVTELVSVWERHLIKRAPDHLPRSLFARLLAYQLQAQLHGGLSKRATAYLKTIEADLIADRPIKAPNIEQKQLKPGTQLVREHEGIHHRVMVLEGGFAWNGMTYASLSAVAKVITGTNWNGPRFFGLKEYSKTSVEAKP
mgnify:CR=1 FL=1